MARRRLHAAAASIDLLVAGQAFHWFDVDQARREALRCSESAGFAARCE